jgi:hypothetical protein
VLPIITLRSFFAIIRCISRILMVIFEFALLARIVVVPVKLALLARPLLR